MQYVTENRVVICCSIQQTILTAVFGIFYHEEFKLSKGLIGLLVNELKKKKKNE